MARVSGTIVLLFPLVLLGCAHGEPVETAYNPDGGALDGEPEEVSPHDEAGKDSSSSDAPVADASVDAVVEAAPCDADVIINEVQTAGSASADDEFVELHNASTCAIPLDGYTLLYRSSDGANDLLVWTPVPGQMMAPQQFFVIGGKAFSGTPDFQFPDQIALGASGGGLGLVKDDTAVDSVAWGDATNAYVESAAAPAPQEGKSIGRLPDGHDTDDNSADLVEATPTPRKSNSPL